MEIDRWPKYDACKPRRQVIDLEANNVESIEIIENEEEVNRGGTVGSSSPVTGTCTLANSRGRQTSGTPLIDQRGMLFNLRVRRSIHFQERREDKLLGNHLAITTRLEFGGAICAPLYWTQTAEGKCSP
jgi:hypothetical protein